MVQSINEKSEVIEHWLRGGSIEIKPQGLDCWVVPNRPANLEELYRNEIRIVKKKVKKYQVLFQVNKGDSFEVSFDRYEKIEDFWIGHLYNFAKLIEESEEVFYE